MTNIVVSNGETLGNFDLLSGDTMWVLSGGTASATSVSSGGREIVSSGGVSLSDTVLSGGLAVLYSGATGSDTTVSSGGTLSGGGMLFGSTTDFGLISGVSIVSGTGGYGSMTVENHGVASGVTVNDSVAFILSGGTARDLLAVGGALVTVDAGGTTTGSMIEGGSLEDVLGVVHGTVLLSGGHESVSAGGLAIGAVISNSGSQTVSSGGVASGAVVFGGGIETILGSGLTVGTRISNGGAENVSAGGSALSSIIASGGNENVSSGGVATGFVISSGGNLTVFSGGILAVGLTGTSTNFGQIGVQSAAEMDLAGTLENGGSVAFENSNVVDVTAASATLTGSGTIDMANSVLITGLATSDKLINVDNTIEGTGQLGGNSLIVINSGTIDANQVNDLTLNATSVTNTGLIEATNAGGTLILYGPVNNSGGVIDAKGGAIALEANASISGGVLSAAGTGQFFVAGSAEFDGTAQALTNHAVVNVQDGLQLTLDGAIDNTGEISLASVGDATDLVIGTSVTLTGSGTILMGDAANNRILGAAAANVLDNVDNTIEGSGEIGAGKLILINGGTIDASGATISLRIDATSVTNTGVMESTGAVGLVIDPTIINNSGGVIAAKLGDVYLEGGAKILGGVLSSTPLSRIFVLNTGAAAVTLNGTASPLTNRGDVNVTDGSQLDLVGAIANSGEISLNATADFTDLVINGPGAALTGGGTLELTDNSDNRIYGAAAADKLTNVDNTIEGGGTLGNSQLTLVNSGTIDASGATNALVLNATSTVNTGLLEATTNPGLLIEGVVRNSGGVIAANGGNVQLEAGGVISGGLLSATDFGYFFVGGAGGTLSGTAASLLTNSATVFVEDGVQLSLAGAIVNDGIISLNSTLDLTEVLAPSANVTLTGSGMIELSDATTNRITGAVLGDVFDNETNTIEGSGEIGGQLTLINRGTIDATGTAASLRIDATAVTNTGLMESTNTAGLLITDTVKNSGGVIAANNGAVFLNGATISGGMLSSNVGGVIFAQGGVTFDGTASQLSNTASVFVEDGVQLFLAGAIVNGGTISLDATADNTDLVVNATNVTLTGSGTIVLSDNADNRIYGAAAADVLDNEGNTIEGAGQIGVGQLTLINRGTIDANGATHSLVIDTTSATNSGLIEATTAPGLIIESVIKNAGGVIGAFGGDVFIQSGAAISGGTFSGQGGGNDLIEVLSGGSVLGASVGDGAVEAVFAGAHQSGVSVLGGGTELVQSGAIVAATAVQSGGVETMAQGAATSGGTVLAGGVLHGFGALRGVIVDQGLVSGGLVGSGLAVGSGGVLDVSSGGQAKNIGVRSGGQERVLSGGSDLRTVISSGGLEALSGGTATSALVSSGGVLRVSSGGVASGTTVAHGGGESIFAGGTAKGTVMSGSEVDFGVASGTQVRLGGEEVVEALGRASGSVISSGGVAIVSSGGVVVAATVSGGALTVSSGASVSGGLALHGGRAVISGTMGAGQTATFTGSSAVLELDNLPGFQAKISGMASATQQVDLGGFTFSAGETVGWVQAGASGTLTVTDGAKSAHLTLIGTYVPSNFHLTNDGHGGTLVDDPRPAGTAAIPPSAAGFAQAIAGLPTDPTAFVSIYRGGTEVITAPSFLTAATSGR